MFYPNDRNFSKALFKARRFKFGCHSLDHVFFYLAFTFAVSFKTNFKWNIKKNRMYFITKAFSHLDPLAAFMRSQVAGIDVIPWHTGDQPGAEQRSKSGKNQALITLFGNVV